MTNMTKLANVTGRNDAKDLVRAGAAVIACCTFRLQQRLYGIAVAHVREVSLPLPMTPVPQAPPEVRGLVNLRSRIYLILDAGPLLGLGPIDCTAESRLLILKPGVAQDVGVLVERGGDIVHVRSDQIETAATVVESHADATSPLVAGVCTLDNELMMIVDPTQLVDAVGRLFRS